MQQPLERSRPSIDFHRCSNIGNMSHALICVICVAGKIKRVANSICCTCALCQGLYWRATTLMLRSSNFFNLENMFVNFFLNILFSTNWFFKIDLLKYFWEVFILIFYRFFEHTIENNLETLIYYLNIKYFDEE